MSTVVQCSGCGGLSSLGEFSRSIIGEKCGCGGVNTEIRFKDIKPQTDFPYYKVRLLEKLRIADEEVKKVVKRRDEIYQECCKYKIIN